MRKVGILILMASVLAFGVIGVTHNKYGAIGNVEYYPSLETQGRYEHLEIGNKQDPIKAVYKIKSDDVREWPVILTIRAKAGYGIQKKQNYYQIWVSHEDNVLFQTTWTVIKIQ